MKFIVDTLPYYQDSCPFSFADNLGQTICPCCDTEEKCPRFWNKYKVCSEDNPCECEMLIEYQKYIHGQKEVEE